MFSNTILNSNFKHFCSLIKIKIVIFGLKIESIKEPCRWKFHSTSSKKFQNTEKSYGIQQKKIIKQWFLNYKHPNLGMTFDEIEKLEFRPKTLSANYYCQGTVSTRLVSSEQYPHPNLKSSREAWWNKTSLTRIQFVVSRKFKQKYLEKDVV